MTDRFAAFVIDDDTQMRQSLAHLLERAGWHVTAFSDARAALAKRGGLDPDVIVSDVRMPGMSGLELLETLPRADGCPLILISAHADVPMAVEAMQKGAYTFLEKPFEPRRLLTALQHAAEAQRLTRQAKRMRADLLTLSGLDRVLLGQDARIVALRDTVMDLAAAAGPTLIAGATGTGKELVARALHRLGPRRDGDFVVVNCATLDPASFEDRLFGTAGANLGLVRRADKGTLFLDEIAACPADVQAKLLRVIETGEVLPVGADVEARADVRIVAATNEDLDAQVTEGAFRADLLFRLNTFQVNLPALRDRGDDVILLFQQFVETLAETYEITPPLLAPEDAAALLSHDWPGNVRELRNVAERRVLAARRGTGSVAAALRHDPGHDDVPGTLREAIASFERGLIAQAIRSHQGRMDAVAEALGIGRRTLNEKIVKLGLDKADLLD